MMEATTNGDENVASLQDENPFQEPERITEGVEITTEEDHAAEEARKEEIRQQMIKVCQWPLTLLVSLCGLNNLLAREKPLQSLR